MALLVHRNYSRGRELYFYNIENDRNSVVSQASCRMDVTPLEQRASLTRGGGGDSSVRISIGLHDFHKISVALSSNSPSQYGYFVVVTLF